MNIPVIGTAVVSSAYWVTRLLMSIDYPVDQFIIINNNGRGELDDDLALLTKIPHKYVRSVKLVNLPGNIGCSGAWNLIIKSTLTAPYWLIVNDDVAFKPGLLKEMNEAMTGDPEVGLVHPSGGDFDLGAWDLFMIRDTVIDSHGLFDENCYPVFCEDSDYIMRLAVSPVKKIVGLTHGYIHGTGDSTEYYEHGSQSQKELPHVEPVFERSNLLNIDYLTEKWGESWRWVSPNPVPFANQTHQISDTKYKLSFVRQKYTGF